MEELSDSELKLLFDDKLILINEEAPSISKVKVKPMELKEPDSEPYKVLFRGNNTKEIGIIINESAQEFLNHEDETLLTNILKATGLSFEDIALINQHNSGTEWLNQIKCSNVFLFGISPSEYNFSSPLYELIFANNAQWIFSDSLDTIGKDKVLKGKLWTKLQEVFPK